MAIRFFSHEVITRQDELPYLWRLRIIETPWFGLYLHRFLSSDDPCLHDHPWWFVSLILWGGYWEYAQRGGDALEPRWYWPGSVLFRRAAWAHRIVVPTPGRTWTLVLRCKRSRPWGFWTRLGWIPWQRYKHQDHCA